MLAGFNDSAHCGRLRLQLGCAARDSNRLRDGTYLQLVVEGDLILAMKLDSVPHDRSKAILRHGRPVISREQPRDPVKSRRVGRGRRLHMSLEILKGYRCSNDR